MRLLLLVGLTVLSAVSARAEQSPNPAQDSSGVYVGVDIPHHDRPPPDKSQGTVGYDRLERAERCQTITVRREDGTVQKIRRCPD